MTGKQEPIGDERLIAEARSDPGAFASLYRRHYDGVFRYCCHRLFDRSAAEDVTSTVFLKVVEKFEAFTGNGRSFRHWLYRIATNAVNEHLRKACRENKLLRGAAEALAARDPAVGPRGDALAENVAILRSAMLTLKARYQGVIAMRFFEKMDVSDIAGVLGSSPGTIRSQLSRALAALRKAISADCEGA